jgi:hypothetical protein
MWIVHVQRMYRLVEFSYQRRPYVDVDTNYSLRSLAHFYTGLEIKSDHTRMTLHSPGAHTVVL